MGTASLSDIVGDARRHGRRIALIATALDLELQAVLPHVEDVVSVVGRDGAFYECGIFREGGQEWLVAIVEAGTGTHAAQHTVTNALIDFGPELQIFVGVAGSRKVDIPIGSVVAADHVYTPYPGKFHEGVFQARPRQVETNHRLINVARKIRRDKKWIGRVKNLADRDLPKFTAYPCGYPPISEIAPAVSTEAVSADKKSVLEQSIASNCGDAAVVETEGYGALFAAFRGETPAIVIRGVSDMTENKDPESDKILQPVAAAHAAAFAFELLSLWAASQPSAGMNRSGFAVADSSDFATDPVAPETPYRPLTARYVLNLDADRATVSAERIAEIEVMLRELASEPGISVEGIEDGSLRLIVRDPSAALERLGASRLRQELEDRFSLHLLGLVPEEVMGELAEAAIELRDASHDLLNWPDTLAGGEHFERPELDQLLAIFEERAHSVTAVIGEPGSGKSALLATLGKRLIDQGFPVLAIKADLLDAEVSNEAELKAWLGLSDRPSTMLTRLAELRPTYLLVDQLDALAGYLDLRTGRLSALLNLVRKLGRTDNIHIVLSARKFEYEHDVRLRSVSAESLQLQLPAWSQVLVVLEQLGIAAAGWPADAQEVLRSPQALATYLQLDEKVRSESLVSYQAMLDRLWDERVLSGRRGAERSKFAANLADTMAEQESLWMPRARFDESSEDIDALVAAGILALNATGSSIGFAHQTVFDYAMARAFAREPGRLSSFVIERQASIFSRPKVWAGLTYLRGADPSGYETEISLLWKAEGLRRHLRLLLIEFLGQQKAPTDLEETLLATTFANPDERAPAFRAATGSPGWFERLRRNVLIASMDGDEKVKGWTANLLSSAVQFAPSQVEQLLETRWLGDPHNDFLIWSVLQQAVTWTDGLLAIGETLLRRTQIAPLYIDHIVGSIGGEQPLTAMRLVRASLDRSLWAARLEATRLKSLQPPGADGDEVGLWHYRNDPRQPIKDIIEGSNEWDTLAALAEQSPSETLDLLWPWFLDALAALAEVSRVDVERPSYRLKLEADFRIDGEHGFRLPEHSLLAALRIAAEKLADSAPAKFRAWMASAETCQLHPVQRLVAHAMSTNPAEYASDAFDFILADVRRLQLGCLEDAWITTQHLISAAAPYWSEAQVAAFEDRVRALRLDLPPDLDSPGGRRTWHAILRRLRVRLLRALPKNNISSETSELLRTEERAIGGDRMRVEYSGVYSPSSIMGVEEMTRAKDEDILNAFRRLPDATHWDHPSDYRKGGNVQLSREFANFAKAEPVRAIRLIKQFDPEFGERAAGYAISAFGEDVDAIALQELVIELVGRGFTGEEFRGSVATAFEGLLSRDQSIDPVLLQTLIDWVFNDAAKGSDEQEEEQEPSSDGKDADERSLLWGYGEMSFVPGGAFTLIHAIVRYFLKSGRLSEAIDFLKCCLPLGFGMNVWSHILPMLRYARPPEGGEVGPSVALIEAIIAQYPALRGTRDLAFLLGHAHWWALDLVERELPHWQRLPSKAGRQSYGELVALVAFLHPERKWPKEALTAIELAGSSDARAGAVLTAANLWDEPGLRDRTTGFIVRVIPNADDAEWRAVFELFRVTGDLPPDQASAVLLKAIADNIGAAPVVESAFVVDRLQSLLPHEAELVARLATGLVERWHVELGDIRTGTAAQAPELVDLAVTLHRLGPATREQGTRLFEMLLDIDAYAARSTLDEIDSRFRPTTAMRRPRLRRRDRQSRRQRVIRPAGAGAGTARKAD